MSVVYRQLIVKYGADVADAMAGAERLNSRIDQVNKDIESKFGALNRKLQSSGTGLTVGITLPLVMAGKAAVDANVRLDNLTRGMTAIMGSSKAAEAEMKRLEKTAKLPALDYEQVLKGSVTLQAAGLSADEARRALEGFGNALATVGKGAEDLDGVQLALSQIMSKGKVSAQEINQLAERVPQIRQVMEKAFGTANTETLQKMEIDARTFVNRVVEELQKLPKATGGVGTAMENMDSATTKALGSMGKAMEPIVISVAGKIEKLANWIVDLDDSQRKWIVGLGAVAAAGGPVLLITSQLIAGYANLKIITMASTIQTAANTQAQAANAVAKNINTAATNTNAAATKALITAQMGSTASATGLRAALAGPLGISAAATIATASLGYFLHTVHKTTSEIDKLTRKALELSPALQQKNEERYTSKLESLTLDQLKARRRATLQQIDAAEKRLKEVSKQADWHLGFDPKFAFIPALAIYKGSVPDMVARSEQVDIELEIERLTKQQEMIQKAIDKFKENNSPAEKLSRQMVESLEREITTWQFAALKAEQVGDVAAAEWAEIQIGYLDRLAANIKTAESDKKFDKVTADALAKEQLLADQARFFLKRQAEEREQNQAEILSAINAQVAKARAMGSELEAAMLEAYRSYQEAVMDAMSIDTGTGRYRYSPTAQQNLISAAQSEYTSRVMDAIKQALTAQVDKARLMASITVENRKILAAAKKTLEGQLEAAMAEADLTYIAERAAAMQVAINAKDPLLAQALLKQADLRRAANKRLATDEYEQTLKSEALSERVAAIGARSLNARSAASKIQAKLEDEASGALRLDMMAQLGDLEVYSAQQDAYAELIQKQEELLKLKERGIDIAERWALAEAEAASKVDAAVERANKAYNDELKTQAKMLDQTLAMIRREEEERQRNHEREIQRHKDLIGFTSLEETWKKAMKGGVAAMYGPSDLIPQMSESRTPTEREIAMAMSRMKDEQTETNRRLDSLIGEVRRLSGPAFLVR